MQESLSDPLFLCDLNHHVGMIVNSIDFLNLNN